MRGLDAIDFRGVLGLGDDAMPDPSQGPAGLTWQAPADVLFDVQWDAERKAGSTLPLVQFPYVNEYVPPNAFASILSSPSSLFAKSATVYGPQNWGGTGPAPSYPSISLPSISLPSLPSAGGIIDAVKNVFSPKAAAPVAPAVSVPTTQGKPVVVTPASTAGRAGAVGPVGPVAPRGDSFASNVAAVTNAVASIFAPFAAAKAQKAQTQAQRNPRQPQVQQTPINWGTMALVGGGIFVVLIVVVAMTGKRGGDARP